MPKFEIPGPWLSLKHGAERNSGVANRMTLSASFVSHGIFFLIFSTQQINRTGFMLAQSTSNSSRGAANAARENLDEGRAPVKRSSEQQPCSRSDPLTDCLSRVSASFGEPHLSGTDRESTETPCCTELRRSARLAH